MIVNIIKVPANNLILQLNKFRKYLVYIPSGQFQSWETNSKDVKLILDISRLDIEYQIILLPFNAKEENTISDDLFVNRQVDVLKNFIISNPLLFDSSITVSLIGISIGAQILASFLSESSSINYTFNKCIFVSLVLEDDLTIFSNIADIYLLYGSNDWVGYLKDGDELEVFAPELYSKTTLNLISTVNYQHKEIILLDGHGHHLEDSETGNFLQTKTLIHSLLQ